MVLRLFTSHRMKASVNFICSRKIYVYFNFSFFFNIWSQFKGLFFIRCNACLLSSTEKYNTERKRSKIGFIKAKWKYWRKHRKRIFWEWIKYDQGKGKNQKANVESTTKPMKNSEKLNKTLKLKELKSNT